MERAFACVSLILACVVSAGAQTGVIRGQVIARDGAPAAGITIAIDRTDILQHFETKSDNHGNFLYSLPVGPYTVSITADGKVTKVNARIEFGRTALKLDLDLRRLAPYDPEQRNHVSTTALAIPRKARDEWRKAVDAKDDLESAKRHLEKAIEIAPEFEEALNDLCTIYHRKKEFGRAAELFERALKVNPDSLTARVNLGAALLELKQYERALDETLVVLKARSDDSHAHAQAGLALFHLGQYQSAIPHLEQATRSDPNSPLLTGYFLASSYDILGNKAAAVTEYQGFLQTHPRDANRSKIEKRIAELR